MLYYALFMHTMLHLFILRRLIYFCLEKIFYVFCTKIAVGLHHKGDY